MSHILLVDDEVSYTEAVRRLLEQDGFTVSVAGDGPAALDAFARAGADVVLLDLALPEMPGTEVCRRLRSRSAVPIIIVSAKDSELDKVVGLELGADDYLTKPFGHRELVARIHAVLRRRREPPEAPPGPEPIEVGGVRLDTSAHTATVDGSPLQLSPKEFTLLAVLLRHAGQALPRRDLLVEVWGPNYRGDDKTLDVHVKRVRAKIEADPRAPQRLVTVRGIGYRYEQHPPMSPARSAGGR